MPEDSSEEPGPATLNINSNGTSGQHYLSSRIHFPVDSQHPRSHRKSVAESTALRQGKLVINQNAVAGSSKDSSSIRRRVVSVDTSNGLRSTTSRRIPTVSMGSPSQRVASLHSSDSKDSDSAAGWGLSTFSDEYDLSHEDPRILQDVQRALKLKHRREARSKSGQLNLPTPSSFTSSPKHSLESPTSPPTSTLLTPNSPSRSESFARTKAKSLTAAVAKPSATDIDFSPSTGPTTLKVESHPVPFSADNGDTLDWSGYASDDERTEKKWTLSVSKRKGKEKELILSTDDLKRQEGLHAAKLARIKTISSQSTAKKVAITSDQLNRRYNLLYSSLSSGSGRFNLLKVSRWYGEQESLIRSSLEKAEPFPWLKHLERRTTRKLSSDGGVETLRMPWHLSALIMEEYLHAQNARNHAMRSIPEYPSVPEEVGDSSSFLPSSILGEGVILPTFPSPSRASSPRFSLSRYISAEGRVSFEPILEPPLSRPSNESRRSVESTYSIFSGSSAPKDQNSKDQDRLAGVGVSSPASSKVHLREGLSFKRRWGNDSDEGSSARNSAAEQSDDNIDKGDKNRKGSKRTSWFTGGRINPLESHTSPRSGDSPRPDAPGVGDDSFVRVEDDLNTAKLEPLATIATIRASLDSETRDITPAPGLPDGPSAPRIINRNLRPLRVSLPSEDRIAISLERKRKQEAEEARADMEYELKSQLVAQCKDSNTRIRSVLNHIAQHIREYEMCQSSFVSSTLGLPYKGGLPQELLEAFSHDPANVTRSTKRLKMYQAVDDIYHRLTRQRVVFKEFIEKNVHQSQNEGRACDRFPLTADILQEPISSLMQSLKRLEERHMTIVSREMEALEELKKTQIIHATVKAEYNSTLAHTSVVYPELSQMVALEESYKDQYQHLWDIGMDALTFILDTVTPFWRTYGKTIGDDVQAFLIIPLYRNEFTGETKRYPILRVPQRSFRHWVGLSMFFVLTIAVLLLQIRAAVSCSSNYKLRWIPYDGIRWAILPLFWIGIVIQWMAALGELLVLLMQVVTFMWWVGWLVRLVS
ncbi:hypothetical protein GYMLUDRAFT_32792 [Collybiopsis luxurians FD-317 M1]|nr:hypothetical protein GYMLUDRAFT_32792 [Collybiopsis luxurians FD-317 M1]